VLLCRPVTPFIQIFVLDVYSVVGIQMRSAIRAIVFSKAMKLRGWCEITRLIDVSACRHHWYLASYCCGCSDVSVGNVVTLALNDSQRLLDMGTFATFLFLCPFASLLIVAILLYVLGPSILAGLGVMVVLVPLQKLVAGQVGKARRAAVPITAQRTSVMNEALNGIKLIKLYAWEKSFADRIAAVRRLEVKQLFVAALFSCLQGTVSWASPSLVTFATFAVNTVWSASPLSPSQARFLCFWCWLPSFQMTFGHLQAFVTVALLNILRFAFSMLPFALRTLTEVSFVNAGWLISRD
jgi:ABC-type multidrug transport system fused ATPase/permease subunit